MGLTSRKKRKYLTIEPWTDVFSIFAYVLRQSNKSNRDLCEDLYTCRFANLAKKMFRFFGVKWIKYYTVEIGWIEEVGGASVASPSFRNLSFPRFCFKFNEGKPCPTNCKYPHICWTCFKSHSKLRCWRSKDDKNGNNALLSKSSPSQTIDKK